MKKENATDTTSVTQKPTCGIIMPISECVNSTGTYSAAHWESMKLFLEDAIRESGYEPRPVWEGADQSVIQSRIVTNIAEFPLMICVICGANINVMIELGLRLMTDKPVFVIYDENMKPPFDVNVLQMFPMPVNPDYKDYQELKNTIKDVLPTMIGDNYKTFLSNFKQIAPKGITGTEKVELAQFMNETKEAIQNMQGQISSLMLQKEVVEQERMRRRGLINDSLFPRFGERIEKESLRQSLETRLVRLRTEIDTMMANANMPAKDIIGHSMDELMSIERTAQQRGLDEYPSIRREIMRVREKIDSVMMKRSRG